MIEHVTTINYVREKKIMKQPNHHSYIFSYRNRNKASGPGGEKARRVWYPVWSTYQIGQESDVESRRRRGNTIEDLQITKDTGSINHVQ